MSDLMLAEIGDQPRILTETLVRYRRQLETWRPAIPDRIILTGSGDSYFATLAAEPLFHEVLDAATWAQPAMTAARYPQRGGAGLLIAVSVSGEVIRTAEAAQRAAAAGWDVLAVVANVDSSLARIATQVLTMPTPITRSTPHTRDYTLTLLALFAVAEHLSNAPIPGLDETVALVGPTVNKALEWAPQIKLPSMSEEMWFLGSGPDRGTAAYAALKFWESGGSAAWWDDLEEFGHGTQEIARPNDTAVVFATGPARNRAVEMAPGLERMGINLVMISDRPAIAAEGSRASFVVGPGVPTALLPLVTCLPVQALTHQLVVRRRIDLSRPLGGKPHGPVFDDVHVEWMRKSRLDIGPY